MCKPVNVKLTFCILIKSGKFLKVTVERNFDTNQLFDLK